MRADRLVAILLLLQSRGQVTAAEVAAELEVSERTARRDLDALGVAGLPIYSRQGRNGGWQLVGGGRTDLSGLTAAEARALFLVAGPSSSATPDVKAALRKLVRALPETFRTQAEAASTAIVVDPVGWDQTSGPRRIPVHLDAVQRAVVEGEQVTLGYVARDRAATTRVVHPLGLATKGTAWYLVAATEAGMRTFRLDRVTSVEPTGCPVVRPDGFDLVEAWKLITANVDELRAPVRAQAWADPEIVSLCRSEFGNRVRIGPAGPDGRVEVELRGHSPEALAREVAGFGGRLEVVEPADVREELAIIGAELNAAYGSNTIVDHYERTYDEGQRITEGFGQLEFVRTREIIRRHLPPGPLRVLDVGGGTGVHARWLAESGHEVVVVDIVPRHVEAARELAALGLSVSAELGDARQLAQADEGFDVVLLLGPLYHLTERADRLRAFREARRVVKGGGLVIAAAISRFASLYSGLSEGAIFDPEFAAVVERDLRDGQHRNPSRRPDWFTTAYFHRPEDFEAESVEAGVEVIEVLGVEGLAVWLPQLEGRWDDPTDRNTIVGSARAVEAEAALRGVSPHLLLVGRKPVLDEPHGT